MGLNPTGGMDVCLSWVLWVSGRGLCDELISRPEESYRLGRVVVCEMEPPWMRRPWPTGGCCAKKITVYTLSSLILSVPLMAVRYYPSLLSFSVFFFNLCLHLYFAFCNIHLILNIIYLSSDVCILSLRLFNACIVVSSSVPYFVWAVSVIGPQSCCVST